MPSHIDSWIQVTTTAADSADQFSVGRGGGITATNTDSPWYGVGSQGTPGAIPIRVHKIIVDTPPAANSTILFKDIGRATGTPGGIFAKQLVITPTDRVITLDPGFVVPEGIGWRQGAASGMVLRMILSVEPHAHQERNV